MEPLRRPLLLLVFIAPESYGRNPHWRWQHHLRRALRGRLWQRLERSASALSCLDSNGEPGENPWRCRCCVIRWCWLWGCRWSETCMVQLDFFLLSMSCNSSISTLISVLIDSRKCWRSFSHYVLLVGDFLNGTHLLYGWHQLLLYWRHRRLF